MRFAHNRFFNNRRFARNNAFLIVNGGFPYYPGYNYYPGDGSGYSQQYYMAPLDYPDVNTGYGSYGGATGMAVGGSVRDVQARLAQLGYYQGSVDGIVGPVTRKAISDYQHDYNLAVTGTVTSGMLARLGSG